MNLYLKKSLLYVGFAVLCAGTMQAMNNKKNKNKQNSQSHQELLNRMRDAVSAGSDQIIQLWKSKFKQVNEELQLQALDIIVEGSPSDLGEKLELDSDESEQGLKSKIHCGLVRHWSRFARKLKERSSKHHSTRPCPPPNFFKTEEDDSISEKD